jgi:hypothetical protein
MISRLLTMNAGIINTGVYSTTAMGVVGVVGGTVGTSIKGPRFRASL